MSTPLVKTLELKRRDFVRKLALQDYICGSESPVQRPLELVTTLLECYGPVPPKQLKGLLELYTYELSKLVGEPKNKDEDEV